MDFNYAIPSNNGKPDELLPSYEDSILDSDHPLWEQAERSFRDAYLAAAQEASEWDSPDFEAIDAAWESRREARERAQVERNGLYYYVPGHEIDAARARGRHHALAFVEQAWDHPLGHDRLPYELPAWYTRVARWAAEPLKPGKYSCPPRPDDDWPRPSQSKPSPSAKPIGNLEWLRAGIKPMIAPVEKAAPPPPETGPVLTCLANIQPRPVSWLWPNRIPLGRISLLVGRPGEGKSFVTIDVASRVSTGTPWPDGSACPKGSIILISAEDDAADTIRPRLDAHYADVSRVHLLAAVRRTDGKGTYERLITLADVDSIETALTRTPDCRLIVIDPIGSFLGGQTDSHRDNEVRAVLAPIAALAEKYGPAVLVVAHRRKSAGSIADDLVLGTRAFTGIARAVWHLTRDPENKSRRLMLPGKNNLAREGDGLAFTIVGDPPHIVWERDPVSMSADDALAAETASRNTKPGPDADVLGEATDWLRSTLASGPRLAKELADEWCNGQGGGKRTLHRAKEALQVEAFRLEVPGPWWWRLPPNIAKMNPGSEHLGNLGNLAKNKGNSTILDAGEPKVAKLNDLGNLGPGAEGTDAPAGPYRDGELFPDIPRLPD